MIWRLFRSGFQPVQDAVLGSFSQIVARFRGRCHRFGLSGFARVQAHVGERTTTMLLKQECHSY